MMPVDVACPNCREQVQVDDQESLCPQCGTDLRDADPAIAPASVETEQNADVDAFAGLHTADSGAHSPDFSGFATEPDPPADEDAVPTPGSLNDFDADQERVPSSAASHETPAGVSAESQAQPTAEEAAVAPTSAEPRGVSRRLFLLVLSYAVLVTLLLGLLVYSIRTGGPHQLESLPDIVPNYRETVPDLAPTVNERGEVIRQIVPENAGLPAGHTLALGESQRFGNVRVTPLKVTREMLEFVHYSGDAARTRSAEGPVLKLWLKFENLSSDQAFAPLDRELLYFRGRTSEESFDLRANNFVAARDDDGLDRAALVYDLVMDGEWDPEGQSLGTVESPRLLRPGEELVTYVPTQPGGVENLQGDLVWRVHIRKGYHRESGRGVTTLIEVVFNSREIEAEA